MEKSIKDRIPGFRREWIRCTHCGAKHSIYTEQAECRQVFVKCTRGCGREFEIIIHNGKQVAP